ncbi:hypothetical protein [Thalassospira sp. HJ]|uniref:hypothetical protein n=1 Tax=Thalassospira sp. HJ TaxID=1616823 RepID=UPI000AF75405|nr:hypothetical protein [Thalassospira sp. HJ]
MGRIADFRDGHDVVGCGICGCGHAKAGGTQCCAELAAKDSCDQFDPAANVGIKS